MKMGKFSILISLLAFASLGFSSVIKPRDVIKRSEYLDPGERFLAEWEVDFETKLVTFDLTVKTEGYVGLGISPGPSMAGADIAIGGVNAEGESYFNDYYAAQNGRPVVDAHKDWELLNAEEVVEDGIKVTKLKIQRLLDTCDDEDVAITEDTQYLIWAIGTTDEIGYHEQGNRGPRVINLLDPPSPPVDTSNLEVWRVNKTMLIPSQDTTYWCSIHSGPNFEGVRHHIVGFKTFLDGDLGLKYTHHATVSLCTPPEGSSAEDAFEQYVTHPGAECHGDRSELPIELCQSIFYIWAVGSQPLFLPPEAGYSIGQSNEKSYVMLEVHYDNQDGKEDAEFDTAVEIYYTEELREIDATLMLVMHDVSPFQTIPPGAKDFVTVGHCTPDQIERMLPEDGVLVFNSMLHAHTAGRAMKVRHFRDGEELPWLASDDHYDFNYQANRPFKEYRQILQGDHLTVECTYDTTARSVVTIGGFPSSKEMCQAFFWTFPTADTGLVACRSQADPEAFFPLLGIEEYEFSGDPYDDLMITKPVSMAGKYTDVINRIDWTDELREQFQQAQRYAPHNTDTGYKTTYPEVDKIWAPEPSECQGSTDTTEPSDGTTGPTTEGTTGRTEATTEPDSEATTRLTFGTLPPSDGTTRPTEGTTGQTGVTTGRTEVTTGRTEVTTGQTGVTTGRTEVTTGRTEVTTGRTEVTSERTTESSTENTTSKPNGANNLLNCNLLLATTATLALFLKL